MTRSKQRPTTPAKFELTDEFKIVDGIKVFRIKYLVDVIDASGEMIAAQGSLGGFVEHEGNLSHSTSSAILDEAVVCGRAKVWAGSIVRDTAYICGNITLTGSDISGTTVLSGIKIIQGSAIRDGKPQITGDKLPPYSPAENGDDAEAQLPKVQSLAIPCSAVKSGPA